MNLFKRKKTNAKSNSTLTKEEKLIRLRKNIKSFSIVFLFAYYMYKIHENI